jgi:hypothetical protein
MIHLGVHIEHVIDGKCKKAMEKTKMLFEEAVNWSPNAKISMISLSTIKNFLVKHFFNDRDDDNLKLLKAKTTRTHLGQVH